jgi:acyl-coenzyme A synthetase/AMP-(fatty) acid ligase
VTSLFPPLLSGRTIEVLDEAPGVGALAEAVRSGRLFSVVKITPSQMDLLRHELSPEELADHCATLVIGGESLSRETAARWRELTPSSILVNEYGPTETVVGCCAYDMPPALPSGELAGRGSVPIGRPIGNTRLYVLDEKLRLVPVGVPGELYVGGHGVARGYLGQPGHTAERFVPDPFVDRPGQRLYRTGDRVRHLPSGDLEYLGRTDDQVKIRGYRVEPAEIESTLTRHPRVGNAAVIAREDTPGDRHLVAYIVAEPAPEESELRRFLEDRLPAYMLPASLVTLERLPLTVGGKVDRAALAALDPPRRAPVPGTVAPRTPLEHTLAQIWSMILGLDGVGVHEDFFELGGHSLLATQVVSRVRRVFQLDLSLRTLFEERTIARFAEVIQQRIAVETEQLSDDEVRQRLRHEARHEAREDSP